MILPRITLCAALGAWMLFSYGCGNTPPVTAPPNQPGTTPGFGSTVAVSIPPGASSLTLNAFGENPKTITQGSTVTWTNDDTVSHLVISNTGQFRSNTLVPGQSYSHTFTDPGSYPYHCGIHPSMIGEIRVSATPGVTPITTPSPLPTFP